MSDAGPPGRLTPQQLIDGLRAHRDVHAQWVRHLTLCIGCSECATGVVAQVGDLDTHQKHVSFYDAALDLLAEATTRRQALEKKLEGFERRALEANERAVQLEKDLAACREHRKAEPQTGDERTCPFCSDHHKQKFIARHGWTHISNFEWTKRKFESRGVDGDTRQAGSTENRGQQNLSVSPDHSDGDANQPRQRLQGRGERDSVPGSEPGDSHQPPEPKEPIVVPLADPSVPESLVPIPRPTVEQLLVEIASLRQQRDTLQKQYEGEYSLYESAAAEITRLRAERPHCDSCRHLRPFELTDELFTCPVVNIRIHRESASVFGCNQHEPIERVSATDEQVKASAARMMEKHRPSLGKLAGLPLPAPPETR